MRQKSMRLVISSGKPTFGGEIQEERGMRMLLILYLSSVAVS